MDTRQTSKASGFTCVEERKVVTGRAGSLTFTEDLRNFEFDPEIKSLSERVKSQFVPSAQA